LCDRFSISVLFWFHFIISFVCSVLTFRAVSLTQRASLSSERTSTASRRIEWWWLGWWSVHCVLESEPDAAYSCWAC
jgi:hypothetical protein